MKNAILAALAVLALAGCGERATPNATFDKPTRPVADAAACTPLPARVALDVKSDLRADYYYINKNGVIRRRVVYHLLEGDIDSAAASVGKSMQAAGFEAVDSTGAGTQRIHARFRKKGYGMAHILLASVPNPGADNPIHGVLTFDLPPPAFNAPRPPKRAAQH